MAVGKVFTSYYSKLDQIIGAKAKAAKMVGDALTQTGNMLGMTVGGQQYANILAKKQEAAKAATDLKNKLGPQGPGIGYNPNEVSKGPRTF